MLPCLMQLRNAQLSVLNSFSAFSSDYIIIKCLNFFTSLNMPEPIVLQVIFFFLKSTQAWAHTIKVLLCN